MEKEILQFCIERGLLIEPEVLNLLSETKDKESVKLIIEKIARTHERKIITKTFLEQNKDQVREFFLTLPEENKKSLEKLKIKLGLEIEISKEVSNITQKSPILQINPQTNQQIKEAIKEKTSDIKKEPQRQDYNLLKKDTKVSVSFESPALIKKIGVGDFVKNLRSRFYEIKNLLQEHQELDSLVSINKLSDKRQRFSIIGMVYDKRITKNKNILLDVEDFTGKIRVLVNQNNIELYEKAEELVLDSIIGFSGFGDKNIFFANNIVFPDIMVSEKKKSPSEEYALFLGDLHYGSKFFMEESFRKFIDYVNGKVPETNIDEISKIKYILLVGDVVAGVGNYPGQQRDLRIDDIEEQFKSLAEILGKIRKDITIIISPGNHDGVRLMEPQPPLDEKYAWPLYSMGNVILTGNPSYVNIGAEEDFPGFDILTYHGFSYPYYANNVQSLSEKRLNAPDKIMRYLLKNRHLAPANSSVQYFPSEKDNLIIRKVPDIFVSGHTHKMAVSSYNGVLIISIAAWEEETEYQKRFGNKPDFCKVPMLNLKTRQIKILDFE